MRSYPSQAIREWCHNIHILVKTMHPHSDDGFCQCSVLSAVMKAPDKGSQAQLASGLFWSVWIDQVMYYVLVNGTFAPDQKHDQFYSNFRQIYSFPKIYNHSIPGHTSPYWLLMQREKFAAPEHDLLLKDKNEFWGEIESWILSFGKLDLRDLLIAAFKEDLILRFPTGYDFLWED